MTINVTSVDIDPAMVTRVPFVVTEAASVLTFAALSNPKHALTEVNPRVAVSIVLDDWSVVNSKTTTVAPYQGRALYSLLSVAVVIL